MIRQHIALHHLVVDQKGSLVCQDGSLFNVKEYSRFKYGYIPPARAYGYDLADLLIREHGELLSDDRPIIALSAPYLSLPTASHAVTTYMVQRLNAELLLLQRPPVDIVHFRKTAMGLDTYAMASIKERVAMLSLLDFTIDEQRVCDANVIVVDDIRVTGTAEQKSAAAIEPCKPHSVWYVHAAALAEQAGLERSELENEMNKTFPTNLASIGRDILTGEFALNTRVAKVILAVSSPPEAEALSLFFAESPKGLLEQIYDGILSAGHEYQSRYAEAFNILCRVARARRLDFAPSLIPADSTI